MKKLIYLISFMLSMLLLIATLPQLEASAKEARVYTALAPLGEVYVQKANSPKRIFVTPGMKLTQGDRVTTGANSTVTLMASDTKDQLIIAENSAILITALYKAEKNFTDIQILTGHVSAYVTPIQQTGDYFSITSGTIPMQIKGTQFLISINPNTGEVTLSVLSGAIAVPSDRPSQPPTNVYPANQIMIDLQQSNESLSEMLSSISSDVVTNILKSLNKVQEENKRLMQNFLSGSVIPTYNPALIQDELAALQALLQQQYFSKVDEPLNQRGKNTTKEELDFLLEQQKKKAMENQQQQAQYNIDNIDLKAIKEREQQKNKDLLAQKRDELQKPTAPITPPAVDPEVALRADIERLTEEKNALQLAITALQQRHDEASDTIHAYETLITRIAETEQQLTQAQQMLHELQQAIAADQDTYAQLEAAYATTIAEQEQQIAALQAQLAALQEQLEGIQPTARIANNTNSAELTLQEQRDLLANEVTELNAQQQSLTTAVTALEATVQELSTQHESLEALQQRQETLATDLENVQAEVATLQAQYEAQAATHNARLAELMQQQTDYATQIQQLEEQIVQLQLEFDVERLTAQKATLQASIDTLVATKETLTNRVTLFELAITNNTSAQQQLTILQQQKQGFTQSEEEFNAALEALIQQIEEQQATIDALNAEIMALQEQLDQLQSGNARIAASIQASLQTQYDELQQEIAALTQQQSVLLEDIAALEEVLTKYEEQYESVEALEAQTAQLTQQAADLQQEIEQLQTEQEDVEYSRAMQLLEREQQVQNNISYIEELRQQLAELQAQLADAPLD